MVGRERVAESGALRVLFVHSLPLSYLGGAELSLAHHVARAPEGVEVDICLPDDERELCGYDAVVLANLRPPGGVGEEAELAWAERWLRRIERYRGFSVRSERDVHPCTHRDGRCLALSPPRRLPCECSDRMRMVFQKLYNACSAVQFLSPSHQEAINLLIEIESRQFVIAAPIDLERFRNEIPFERRKRAALILGDAPRVAVSAPQRARRHGFKPEWIPYLSVPPERMPALYNRYQAVVVDPVMLHAFGRVFVEAMACGCRVLASERVGALSWEDPIAACREANDRFWEMVTRGTGARA